MSRILQNLPLPDFDETGLVGRGEEQRSLRKLILDGRQPVVTVAGEAGVGKTALTVSTLYSLLDDPECPFEAILWISLKAEILTAAGVEQLTVAARDALGIAEALGAPLGVGFLETASQLGENLRGIPALVVIDNLETVDASEVITLFDALPVTTQLVLTSRVGLGQLERRFPLGPLRQRDAQHLLRALARTRGLEVIATLADREMVSIVDALRNNPLAVKWFILAVEAGGQPELLLRHQERLLEYCVRSIYDGLTAAAKILLELLFALARPAGFGELVVLSGLHVDETRMALHELQRSSLLDLDTMGGPGLVFLYSLSSTAYQFTEQVQPVATATLEEVRRRDSELRRSEERRRLDEEQRGLAPQAVRLRSDADEPVAHLLRQALSMSKRGDLDSAREMIAQAHSLAPDYFEVPRVSAFIESMAGNLAIATQQYEKALRFASETSRPVVEFFFAGHLARVGHDPQRALPLAQAAHQGLHQPETANILGQIHMYLGQHKLAEEYFSEAAAGASGKLAMIVVTNRVNLRRRLAESVADEERKPVDAFRIAIEGVELGVDAMRGGTIDRRLDEGTFECAREAARIVARRISDPVLVQDELTRLAELADSMRNVWAALPDWPYLERDLQYVNERTGSSNEVHATVAVEQAGTITSYFDDKGYGFLLTDGGSNLFFGRFSLEVAGDVTYLFPGVRVRFSLGANDRGPCAIELRVDHPPSQPVLPGRRRGVVVTLQPSYCFVQDVPTGKRIFMHRSGLLSAAEWVRVLPGVNVEFEVMIGSKGAQVAPGSAALV